MKIYVVIDRVVKIVNLKSALGEDMSVAMSECVTFVFLSLESLALLLLPGP